MHLHWDDFASPQERYRAILALLKFGVKLTQQDGTGVTGNVVAFLLREEDWPLEVLADPLTLGPLKVGDVACNRCSGTGRRFKPHSMIAEDCSCLTLIPIRGDGSGRVGDQLCVACYVYASGGPNAL